ncbi:protein-disulfide reductase DsbD family protein [Tsuneonella sp. YG55]|uniref:Protein-disulfide reductase DsbD family protein n=1 Tax=Tsuneonella litorea TaxID=2976475 RepID=A0A9X3AL37_9SPHN|nr:protein-disulfide reductase DsbD domain-containing protein [Tsuneonella litorea]MCT2559189.1 protein-disulfide reductase DsbD family protein [Tsuneonella litorea]
MRARTLPLLAAICALLFALVPGMAAAQDRPTHIAARLVAEGPAVPGKPLTLAIAFDPEPGWHGYWKNPGDAGYGMELDWDLPAGWRAGEPQYPVPQKLVIGGLMNHVYEGPYAVLVDVAVPPGAGDRAAWAIAVDAQWLACTDTICVPERARLTLDPGVAPQAPAFDKWRAAIPAMLDRQASFALRGERLRIAIPIPASMAVGTPHVFLGERDLVRYADVQTFAAEGDLLIAELPLAEGAQAPEGVSGILSFGDGNGVRFAASPGPVPSGGVPLREAGAAGVIAPLWLLLLGALAGGLLLNVMPCVFPILSLKALSLARAGESDAKARAEGLAYSAGVILATVLLGALLLALRSAGEMVGWAFQLQEPAVVVGLLVLATAITANLAGLYELPSLSLTRGGEPASAFATGLLAAFVATPCTGPFMAAAMGAALLLPKLEAMLLFAVLGLGLALPFLLLGFVPPLRRMLPRPGPWMERFRRWMALPMGLTALALVWLCWRLGGTAFALIALALAVAAVAILAFVGRRQHAGRPVAAGALAAFAVLVVVAVFSLSRIDAAAPGAARVPEGEAIAARPFSEARLAAARAGGKPVFVWFTADWCLTCKVNERVAIDREATKAAFEAAGVVALVGDWTRRDPAITRFLARHGAAGVPLYLWYAPGGQGEVMPQVLTSDDLVRRAGAASPRTAAR